MTHPAPSRHRSEGRRATYPFVVVGVGVLVTGLASWGWLVDLREDTRNRFARHSAETARQVGDELRRTGDALRGVRGLFTSSQSVERAEFRSFVTSLSLDDRYSGVYAVSYTAAVPPSGLPALVAQGRADGVDLTPRPAGTRSDYRVVVFSEPVEQNRAAIGFDRGATAEARAAQDLARDTGEPVAGPPDPLVPEPGADDGFVLYLPLYQGGQTPGTVAARRASLIGWLSATVRGQDFVRGVFGTSSEPVAVELTALRATATAASPLGRVPADAPDVRRGMLTTERQVDLYGATWTLRLRTLSGFTPQSYRIGPLVLLAGGLLLTALMALFVHVLVGRRRTAERQADDRTRDLRASETRFRTLAQSSPTGVFFASASGRLDYLNPRLREICGLEYDAVVFDLDRLLHPDDAGRFRVGWLAAVEDDADFRSQVRVVRPDGTVRWVDVVTAPLRDDAGEPVGWVGSANDVTDVMESRRHADRLARIFESTSDQVAIWDRNGVLIWANTAARGFAGLAPGTATGGQVADLVAPAWRNFYAAEVLPTLARDGRWAGELALHGANGDDLPVSQVILAHDGPNGVVEYYSSISRDLSERKGLEDKLAHEALHDRLTGLPNRVLFGDRLAQALVRARRRRGLLGVLFLDVDRFKVVNDSLGHEAGDALLVEVAERLRAVLGDGDTASRFGGDEFTVLCEDVGDESHLVETAERILDALATPLVVGGSQLHVGASIGIALSTGHHRPDDLLRDADVAMYRAKDRGRGRYEMFDEKLRAHAVRRLEVESALHRAIERGELRVHYQPEVLMRDGRIVATEALVRWMHPKDGLVSPAEFIPLAEETGLIDAIGIWVLRTACEQAVKWRRVVHRGEPLTVWVNLSPHQLAHDDVVDLVATVLAETGVDPRQIGLEITETALLDDADTAIATLRRLKALGVQLSLDDFGTGYSSLSYLKRLPIDAVKVDRSFVSGLTSNVEDTAIMAAIVGMASALEIVPLAEGIETAEQAARVTSLGFVVGQGFYFARPMPAEDLDVLLDGHSLLMPQHSGVPEQRGATELFRPRRAGAG